MRNFDRCLQVPFNSGLMPLGQKVFGHLQTRPINHGIPEPSFVAGKRPFAMIVPTRQWFGGQYGARVFMETLLCSIADAGKALNLGRSKVYDLISDGRLVTITSGGGGSSGPTAFMRSRVGGSLMPGRNGKGPGTAATVRRAGNVASGKPTALDSSNSRHSKCRMPLRT